MYTQATTLTEKVLYLQNHPEQKTLKQKLLHFCEIIIYTYPVQTKLLDREEASELLLSVHPRIENLLLSFTDQGIPFEIYMKKVSYLQAVSFKKMKRKERRRFVCDYVPHEDIEYLAYAVRKTSITDETDELQWDPHSPIAEEIREKVTVPGPFRNRILHLILLCGDLLSAPCIAFLADYLGMDELVLAEMIKEAMERSSRRIEISDDKKRIRDTHFSEKQFLEREYEYLSHVDAHPQVVSDVERRLETQKQYWKVMKDKVVKRPGNITHAVAAGITGTPKGTVDSGLQSLYRYLKKRVDE